MLKQKIQYSESESESESAQRGQEPQIPIDFLHRKRDVILEIRFGRNYLIPYIVEVNYPDHFSVLNTPFLTSKSEKAMQMTDLEFLNIIKIDFINIPGKCSHKTEKGQCIAAQFKQVFSLWKNHLLNVSSLNINWAKSGIKFDNSCCSEVFQILGRFLGKLKKISIFMAYDGEPGTELLKCLTRNLDFSQLRDVTLNIPLDKSSDPVSLLTKTLKIIMRDMQSLKYLRIRHNSQQMDNALNIFTKTEIFIKCIPVIFRMSNMQYFDLLGHEMRVK